MILWSHLLKVLVLYLLNTLINILHAKYIPGVLKKNEVDPTAWT